MDVKSRGNAPLLYNLYQNYPDPFNPSTMIQFTVPSDGRAILKVYNMLGQEVATLFDGIAEAGVNHQSPVQRIESCKRNILLAFGV